MSSKSGPLSEPSENELQKWTLLGARPGGLREALTILLERQQIRKPAGRQNIWEGVGDGRAGKQEAGVRRALDFLSSSIHGSDILESQNFHIT